MKLYEIFDNSFDFEWGAVGNFEDGDIIDASFKISNGDKIAVSFMDWREEITDDEYMGFGIDPDEVNHLWEVNFKNRAEGMSKYDLTNKNVDTQRILSTVIQIMHQFLDKYPKVQALYFSSKKSDGRDRGRTKLYSRILKTFANSQNITYRTGEDGRYDTFIIIIDESILL
jgi:hypothetical protein